MKMNFVFDAASSSLFSSSFPFSSFSSSPFWPSFDSRAFGSFQRQVYDWGNDYHHRGFFQQMS